MSRVELHPAWILHTRAFRDTSLLVDLLTKDYGRVSGVLRGVRQSKSAKRKTTQPFVPLLVSWSGKSELVSLSKVEAIGQPRYLMGKALLSGLYLNELLVRLLHRDDPHPVIYDAYGDALNYLQQTTDITSDIEPILRVFEMIFLSELGYGFEIDRDYQTGEPVQPEVNYRFTSWKGMTKCAAVQGDEVFLGAHLIAAATQDFADRNARIAAKRLMRLALQALLGNRTLKTRSFF